MNKSQWKDFIREIKRSLTRFLSILCMVALGVAFFVGVRSSEPDMRLSADTYYDATNFHDIRVVGTLGLTDEDVEAIRNIEGITDVTGAYKSEALTTVNASEYIFTVYSICNNMNNLDIMEGRLPEKANECFADKLFIDDTGLKPGDSITLTSGTSEGITETLETDTYVITGYGTYAGYLSWERGSAGIGNGDVDAFLFLPESAYSSDIYTDIYATVDSADALNCYGDDYKEYIDSIIEDIEKIADARCEIRYNFIMDEGNEKIAEAEAEIKDTEDRLADAEAELAYAKQMLADGAKELAEAELEFRDKKAEAEIEIADAKVKIDDAKQKLADIEVPEWYVLGRNAVQTFVEYDQDSERIGAIGKLFPVIFFLVAALVSLTTMTRMVEEERMQIGTLKALGYSKMSIASKFLLYALFAGIIGGVIGMLVGSRLLPYVIIKAYGILYVNIQNIITPINLDIAVSAIIIANLCTLTATFFACYKELLATPAVLMRPPAPKMGKRVFLEKINFIWKHLNFSKKATVRNLLRYKKRFFMTVIGIGGCMALLMVSFGLQDSIKEIVNNQYRTLWTYDAYLSVDGIVEGLAEKAEKNESIQETLYSRLVTTDVEANGITKNANLFIPETLDVFPDFVTLKNRVSKDKYAISEDGVVISEKLASLLSVGRGDTFTIKKSDTEAVEVMVTDITENYLYNYIYMSSDFYTEKFMEEIEYNQLLLKTERLNTETKEALGAEMLKLDGVKAVSFVVDLENTVNNMMNSLNLVIWVLIISAGLLAFVVLYNLNNINIIERRRELATIKVLGFYDGELAAYVYRENILLTVFGIIVGIFMGLILHQFVIRTCEIDMIMFGREIKPMSYLYCILLTWLFTVVVNFVMLFKLRNIDMVESLKSVE